MDKLEFFSQLSERFKSLYRKTDKRFLEIEGIALSQLDISMMSDRYFSEKIVDMSVDENANFNEGNSFGSYLSEVEKSGVKLVGYHDLHSIISEEFGAERADQVISSIWNGDFYLHDSTSIQIPYCWSYSAFFFTRRGKFLGSVTLISTQESAIIY